MLLSCILLAISISIDSLGIGLTYGIKNTTIPKTSNIILFAISFCITCSSIFLGHYISVLLSPTMSQIIGSFFLIMLGLYNIHKAQISDCTNYDLDHSNNIDKKEALFLGLALSVDAACVGIGSGIIGLNDIILPILVASFQLFFINCGNLVAKNIIKSINISEKFLSIFSSVVLILVGILRILLE